MLILLVVSLFIGIVLRRRLYLLSGAIILMTMTGRLAISGYRAIVAVNGRGAIWLFWGIASLFTGVLISGLTMVMRATRCIQVLWLMIE